MAKDEPSQHQVNLNPETTPILYTDMIFINVNEDGAMLDVCQKVGATNQYHVVSRIGMSREHAARMVKQLSEMLALTQSQRQTGKKN